MLFDDFFADREPDARACILFTMRTLKDLKELVDLRRINADAIVTHRKALGAVFPFGPHVDVWGSTVAKLDGIIDQFQKDALEMRGIGL